MTLRDESETEMLEILEKLLDDEERISARAVARVHSKIKHASSITRNPVRSSLLERYRAKQLEIRSYTARIKKSSRQKDAISLTEKDQRIEELERQIEILTASHSAMIRAVGELGGMGKWLKFFENHTATINELRELGAIPVGKISTLRDGK